MSAGGDAAVAERGGRCAASSPRVRTPARGDGAGRRRPGRAGRSPARPVPATTSSRRSTVTCTSIPRSAAQRDSSSVNSTLGRRTGAVQQGDLAVGGSRSAQISSTAGRSGASPMPPATITTSRPRARRRPTRCRTGRARRAGRRTRRRPERGRPRRRRGWCAGERRRAAGSPLIEIGTSPTPKAWSIVNWPGCEREAAAVTGSSQIVAVSRVSWRRPRHRGRGAAPSGSAASTAGSEPLSAACHGRAVEVEEPDPGGVQTRGHHLTRPAAASA